MEKEFEIAADDAQAETTPEHEEVAHPSRTDAHITDMVSNSKMGEIISMMAGPESDLTAISRLIALEIVGVIQEMTSTGLERIVGQNNLNNHIRALRDLQKTLTEAADAESKKDVLNMDGPKFAFVFRELLELFDRSLVEAGVNQESKKQVMLHFRDLVSPEQERIQREVNKIERRR